MNKFKVGDKVAVYDGVFYHTGTVDEIVQDTLRIDTKMSRFHYKQCRKLVKKIKIGQTYVDKLNQLWKIVGKTLHNGKVKFDMKPFKGMHSNSYMSLKDLRQMTLYAEPLDKLCPYDKCITHHNKKRFKDSNIP